METEKTDEVTTDTEIATVEPASALSGKLFFNENKE